jgi:uncharacterized phosphosugar-binding protein
MRLFVYFVTRKVFMTHYINQYFSYAIEQLGKIQRESGEAIHQAASAVADAIQNDKDFLLFGSGHSTFIAHEAAGRAGGLAPALAIQDYAYGDAERIEGVARVILSRYDLRAGSVIVIISNSGINPVPVEMALMCKDKGLTVVAVVSMAHTQSMPPRHSSGKKLYEIADIVIDTQGPPGDAALEVPGTPAKSGATSTLAGAAIIQAITVETAALLHERGIEPPIFISANSPGGDEHNERLLNQYWSRLVRHEMASTLTAKQKPGKQE